MWSWKRVKKRSKQSPPTKCYPIYLRNLSKEMQEAILKDAGAKEKVQLESYILTTIVLEGK